MALGVQRQFYIVACTCFFQDAGTVSADSISGQAELCSNFAYRLARCEQAINLVFTV